MCSIQLFEIQMPRMVKLRLLQRDAVLTSIKHFLSVMNVRGTMKQPQRRVLTGLKHRQTSKDAILSAFVRL